MSKFTDFLNLFKWDSIADAEEEFNIDKALNENWDKIDTKLKTYITNLQTNKVDKEDGKNLSTNDYTNEEKEKLNNIESNAQVNLIEKIQKNGVDIDIINKIVNLILTKNDVGLSNVDNTSDIDKPLSNATTTELGKKLDKTSKATSTEAIAGANNTKYTTPYTVKSAIEKALEGYTPSGGGGGGDTLPIGAILPFSSDTIPNGWLLCDGSSFSATSYPELFDVIGVTYGWDDDRNPKLPDLRGRVAVGKKDATSADDTEFSSLGKTGGEKTHTLTVDEMPSHNHDTSNSVGGGSGNTSGFMWSTTLADWGKQKTTATGGGQPHNNLQPYIVTNYIIKAKMTVAIEGEIIQEDGTASETNVYSASAMDNKIQSLKRVTLYENASGTNTTLTLNDSVANYEDIEIFYKSNDNAYSSVKVNNANNKNIVLVNMTPNTTNNVLYVKATIVKAQNDSITVVDGLEGYGSGGITAGNKNYIVKVVGYKEV